jgi:hypothetical protein
MEGKKMIMEKLYEGVLRAVPEMEVSFAKFSSTVWDVIENPEDWDGDDDKLAYVTALLDLDEIDGQVVINAIDKYSFNSFRLKNK